MKCDYGRKSGAKKYSEWLLNRVQYEAGDILLLILLILVLKAQVPLYSYAFPSAIFFQLRTVAYF